MVKRRLEWFVLDQDDLLALQPPLRGPQRLLKQVLAISDIILPGVVRAVRKPKRKVTTVHRILNSDTIVNMVECGLANLSTRVGEGTQLVMLVLEDVRIDRADLDPVASGKTGHRFRILSWLKVTEHMNGYARATTGKSVHLAGIRKFVRRIDGGSCLKELAETRAGIGKAPAGDLYLKFWKRQLG